MRDNRRDFLKKTLTAAAALSIPSLVSAAFVEGKGQQIKLKVDDLILFQGDSITDASRDRKQALPNISYGLGSGYAMLAASNILNRLPEKNFKFYNRGVSGDKVYQLADRWEKDCLELKPNVLSIMIGVNDFWAVKKHGYTGTIQTYRDDYHRLIERTKKQLPDVKLIIGEPYAVSNVKEVTAEWYPAFHEFRAAAKAIAQEFNCGYIPYQTIFDKAQLRAPAAYWTFDGVHPTAAGNQIMAEAWLQAVK